MNYLGTVLTGDVHDQHELVKRIAMAKIDFMALDKVWRRSSLTWRRKLDIFHALVQSKLLYSLSTVCLTLAQERRLNGFQNRCLRTIIGVAPSFVSRVSNEEVWRRCERPPATRLLRKRQLQLLGKILRSPEGHPLRTCSLIPNSCRPVTDHFVRRRGRPAKEWMKAVMDEATRIFGGFDIAMRTAQGKLSWEAKL